MKDFSTQPYGQTLITPGGGSPVPLRSDDGDQTHLEVQTKPIGANAPAMGALMQADFDGLGIQQWPFLLTTAAYWNDVPGRVNPVVNSEEQPDWTGRTRQRKTVTVNLRKSLTDVGILTGEQANAAGSPGERFVKRMATLFTA